MHRNEDDDDGVVAGCSLLLCPVSPSSSCSFVSSLLLPVRSLFPVFFLFSPFCVCSLLPFFCAPSQAITTVALKLEPPKKRSRASPFEIGSGFLLCLWLAFYWFFLGLASASPGSVYPSLFPQVLVSARLCDLPVLSPSPPSWFSFVWF
uniref:Transmembrane protein n=1 Tax=Populus davidiana TaxID=266767 RepID=A0A6M2EK74_9ROSI